MDARIAARGLEALGNETRLEVFRLLVRAGEDGIAVGEIQARLGVPASTLSHHIAYLMKEGLVTQERRGRSLVCRAGYDRMRGLIDYLVEHCCEGLDARRPRRRKTR
jgi:DNA-binding transcriptional ArsR family regulator